MEVGGRATQEQLPSKYSWGVAPTTYIPIGVTPLGTHIKRALKIVPDDFFELEGVRIKLQVHKQKNPQ